MNLMVFDNPQDKEIMGFISKSKYSIISKYPEKKLSGIKEMWKYCKDILKNTSKDDKVIFWYDFLGVLFYLLTRIKFKKRNIFILNILLKDKKSLKNRIARILYKKALKNKRTSFTVTSTEYGDSLKKILKINKEYYLLHDPYHNKEISSQETDSNYIFCGGRNGRDWDLMINIAQQMPAYNFHFVLSKNDINKYKDKLSSNINVKSEISLNEFEDEIKNSSLVVLPLNTEAPAGLLVLYQSANYGKLIITSDTLTTREYLSDGKGILCKKSINDWISNISMYMENQTERKRIGELFKTYLIDNCSDEKYLNNLERFVFLNNKGELCYG